MDLMAYWRWDIYHRDLDEGAGFNFNSRQSRLHTAINIGERLWLVSGKPTKEGVRYILLACFQIIAKTENPPDYKYGPYRVWADFQQSSYFDAATAPDVGPLLRKLGFSTDRPIQTENIGQALQTMRSLTAQDSDLLETWVRQNALAREPRAYQVSDEFRLELAYQGGEDRVRETVAAYHTGASTERRNLLLQGVTRNRKLVDELHRLYHGRCQLCGYDPILLYSVRACDAHHIIFLSRGGPDELTNMMLLCPNHHAVIHATNAVFDYKDFHYVFANGRREPLVLDVHLRQGHVKGNFNG